MKFCYQCKWARVYTAGTKEYIFCKKIYDITRPGIPGYTMPISTTKKIDAQACARFEKKED